MATSGVSTFNLTRDQIITEALTNIGQFDPEGQGAPTGTQINQGALRLNTLTKAWQADGLQLWKRQLCVIFLQQNQKDYTLGSNGGAGGDNATTADGFVQTTIPGGANSGASTITVTSALGISNGMFIGIRLSTGAIQWTTVNGAPAGNIITLAASLTASANVNAVVYSYTTQLSRPIRLLDGYMRTPAGNDTPIRILSFEEYNRFGFKTSPGQTTQCFLHPKVGYATLSVYPVSLDTSFKLYLELHYPFQDFTQGTDTPDMPQEWLQALIWGLSNELAMSYGVTETRMIQIKQQSDYWRTFALATSQENSVMFQPDPVTTWAWSNEVR